MKRIVSFRRKLSSPHTALKRQATFGSLESMEARLAKLEAENAELKAELSKGGGRMRASSAGGDVDPCKAMPLGGVTFVITDIEV
jgi:hypothetical protein